MQSSPSCVCVSSMPAWTMMIRIEMAPLLVLQLKVPPIRGCRCSFSGVRMFRVLYAPASIVPVGMLQLQTHAVQTSDPCMHAYVCVRRRAAWSVIAAWGAAPLLATRKQKDDPAKGSVARPYYFAKYHVTSTAAVNGKNTTNGCRWVRACLITWAVPFCTASYVVVALTPLCPYAESRSTIPAILLSQSSVRGGKPSNELRVLSYYCCCVGQSRARPYAMHPCISCRPYMQAAPSGRPPPTPVPNTQGCLPGSRVFRV